MKKYLLTLFLTFLSLCMFGIIPSPSRTINLTAPSNGFNVNTGETVNFTWTTTGDFTNLDLLVSVDNGENYMKMDDDLVINASWGTLPLTIPHDVQTGIYYLKLVASEDYTIQSNAIYGAVTDVAFLPEYSTWPPKNATNVETDLSNLRYPGKLAIEFKENINLGTDKEIHIKCDDPVVDLTLNTLDNEVSITGFNGSNFILLIEPTLPLQDGATYYVTMEEGVVEDVSGNAFAGFTENTEWSFTTGEELHVSGKIEYDGSTTGELFIILYDQTDFSNLDFSKPKNVIIDDEPNFPIDYSMSIFSNGEYSVLSFIDYNGNERYDEGEPLDYIQNIIINNVSAENQDMRLEEPITIDGVFNLDEVNSYWTYGETNGVFTPTEDSTYSTGTKDNKTAMTSDSYTMATDLYGIGFWLEETDRDDLAGSNLEAGTKLHLEYTFPSGKEINFIAAGSEVTGMKVKDQRLIIDMIITNPVHSASGDMGASCGITISCNPIHSGGVNCYGSIFYGDLYVADMGMAISQNTNMVGMSVNGHNGTEAHFTGLFTDDFLINTFGMDAQDLPANSSILEGEIPDLTPQVDYTVDNSFDVITSGYDTDGDGTDNKIYKAVINNSTWSAHDLLFGAKGEVTKSATDATSSYLLLSQTYIHVQKAIESLEIIDISGKTLQIEQDIEEGTKINTTGLKNGIYLIRINGSEVVKYLK